MYTKIFFSFHVLIGLMINGYCLQRNDVNAGISQQQTRPLIILMPVNVFDSAYRDLNNAQLLLEFYSDRSYFSSWTSSNGISPLGDSLINVIENINRYGLSPGHYHINEINVRLHNTYSPDNLVRMDALLSDAFVSIATDLQHGRQQSFHNFLDRTPEMQALKHVSVEGNIVATLSKLEPDNRQYQMLKKKLATLLDTVEANNNTDLYTSTDSSLSAFDKIQTLSINLERWRSEQSTFPETYIFINIPSFKLYVISHDSVILESKVIVGLPDKQTPEVTSKIECFITYPYWHVPRKIAVEEYLPTLKKNTSFLAKNHFEVLDHTGKILNADSLPWHAYNKNYFPVMLRQQEGTDNALGIIKFVFDNPYGIYLHDTNAKRLFRSDVRAFSHGCIRMEKALELAHYLAMGKLGERSKYVDRFLKKQQKRYITLPKPMPIFVRYLTADCFDEQIHFYHDIYNKDAARKQPDLIGAYTSGL